MSKTHWDDVWSSKDPTAVSWYQATPAIDLELIERVTEPDASILDVGGGASRLVDELLAAGYGNVTVLDLAPAALDAARRRLGAHASRVTWIAGDVCAFEPDQPFDVWHDRAVLHFLTTATDRRRYLDALRATVAQGGHVVLATFGPTGPELCSGLPVRRYAPEDMAELLGDEFAMLDHVDESHRTPAGATQDFVYGLFRRAHSRSRSASRAHTTDR